MTMLEEDLFAALKELYESSRTMTNGTRISSEEMTRYYQALAWSERVLALAEKTI